MENILTKKIDEIMEELYDAWYGKEVQNMDWLKETVRELRMKL